MEEEKNHYLNELLDDLKLNTKQFAESLGFERMEGADWAITVSGESMAPEYPSGAQILVKKINEKAFIGWGKVYVLDTCNGTVIKILTPSKKTDA